MPPPVVGQAGMPTGFRIPVQNATGNESCVGVCRTNVPGIGERFWISAGAISPTPGLPHKLYVFNRLGTLLGSFDQPTTFSASNLVGLRDLTSDGTYLYGGQEGNTVRAFNTVTNTWAPAMNITLVAPPIAIVTALTFLPATDTFLCSDGGPLLREFNRAGVFIAPPRPVPAATTIAGAAFDAMSGNIFLHTQTSFVRPGITSVFYRHDLATGFNGGEVSYGDLAINAGGGQAGGLDMYVVAGRQRGVFMSQANAAGSTDEVVEIYADFSYGPTCPIGPAPVRMDFAGGAPYAGNSTFTLGFTTPPGWAGGLAFFLFSATEAPPLPLPFLFTTARAVCRCIRSSPARRS
ncbi:MAG: hypothetical protein ABIP94_04630 [Planctomycetota bacterium]